jgi:3-dehydroquinate dehydratase/shikimate dehydrogenase
MIIISVGAGTFPTLLKKAKLAQEKADLIEIRLDTLPSFSEKEIEKLNVDFSPLFTLRSKKEGGEYSGSILKRKKILQMILDQNPAYIDLEYKRDLKLIQYLNEKSPKTKCILSYHEPKKMPNQIEKIKLEMEKYCPWKMKIVGYAHATVDALEMLQQVKKHKNLIAIAMGEKGILTRILGPLYGQPITYCSLEENKMAPGQFTFDALESSYHYSKLNSKTVLLGLIGNPVWQSPGAKVYNKIFAELNVNALYVNLELEVKELARAIELMQALKFTGCSVTIPYKEKILTSVTHLEGKQKGIASVNTLKFKAKSIRAKNTDGEGALALIEKLLPVSNKKVLIIGAGGTAYGVGFVLKQHGAKITFMNRTDAKANALAEKLKGHSRPFARLPYIEKDDYDILIHTTSVGTGNKSETLIPQHILFPGKIVIDVVLTETELIENADKKGCTTFNGKAFWVAQGSLQMAYWLESMPLNFSELMRTYLP